MCQWQILQSDLTKSPINGIGCIPSVPGIVADRQTSHMTTLAKCEYKSSYRLTHN